MNDALITEAKAILAELQKTLAAVKGGERDPDEPGVAQKLALQGKLYRAIRRRFAAQADYTRNRLQGSFPGKSLMDVVDILAVSWAEYDGDIIRVLIEACKGGVMLAADEFGIALDWTPSNTAAALWARKHAGELVKGIDETTQAALREIVGQFIETPGVTISDIMDALPYGDARSMTIAVTETTNAYAEGEKIAGEQLRREHRGVKVVKIWHTNADDRVCEICGPLDGVEVDIEDMFESGGEEIDKPAAHVNCRCWITYRTRI